MAQSRWFGSLVVVKLGGSVITNKRRRFTARKRTIARLARELSEAKHPLVLVHGGGSFGHPLALEHRIGEGFSRPEQLSGFSLTHQAMQELNSCVIEGLCRSGVPAIPVQPSACCVVKDGRIKSMELAPLKQMLAMGILPVLYGDVVPDLSRGMSILSGDQLVVYLALNLGASRAVIGVDVDGVYAQDPRLHPRAKLIPRITPSSWRRIRARLEEGPDATGGMVKKVEELLALARAGIQAEILNAAKPEVLKRAILGETGLGTIIERG